jgi:hypothetical protein
MDAGTADATTQKLLVLENISNAATNTLENMLYIDNQDANAVTAGITILGSSTGAITTAIDASDAEIGTALAIGSNDITTTASTLSSTELDRLNGVTGALYFAGGTDVAVTDGGTGLGTLTANNVILGNGTSTPLFVAPGTSGNVLTSNGTTWSSSAVTIPQGTGPTVDAAGEVAQDTTDDQLLYGATPHVLAYTYQACVRIENPTTYDSNMTIWVPNDAVTITEVGCRYDGTGTTVGVFALEDAVGTAMTLSGALTCVTGSTASTFRTVTGGGGLTAGEGLRIDTTTAPSPVTDDYLVCWRYTVDRQ